MPRFLIAIHHPYDYNPSAEDEEMRHDIDALNDEMVAAGVRVFVGGLHPVARAIALVPQPDGGVLATNGAYLKAPESIGGLWVLETPNLDEAVRWGRKAALACRAAVEVREFH